MLLPNGRRVDLEAFHGLNQIGETGLRDQVDRHYAEIFGASLAVGAIAGLAQAQTSVGLDASALDVYRQGAATSLAQSSARILDRFLNLLPTVTIREGHRIKVYLSNDLELPAYRDEPATAHPRRLEGIHDSTPWLRPRVRVRPRPGSHGADVRPALWRHRLRSDQLCECVVAVLQLQQQFAQLVTTYQQIRTQYLLILQQSQRVPVIMNSRYRSARDTRGCRSRPPTPTARPPAGSPPANTGVAAAAAYTLATQALRDYGGAHHWPVV